MKKLHSHTLTNILKFTLFSFIMLAPIFAVASKCLYVTMNKNAQDSYSNNEIIKTSKVINSSQQIVGQEYLLNYVEGTYTSTSATVNFSSSTIDWTQFTGIDFEVYGYRIHSSGNYIYVYDQANTQYNIITSKEQLKNLMNGKTIILADNSTLYQNNFYFDYYLLTYVSDKLDNVFYYAIDQLNDQPIFNWAKDTGIYNTLSTFTTGISGTENNTLALLLSYWFILTAIYIVVDLIMYVFTYLTHILVKDKE